MAWQWRCGVTLTEIFSPIYYVGSTQVYLHLTTTTTINFKAILRRSISKWLQIQFHNICPQLLSLVFSFLFCILLSSLACPGSRITWRIFGRRLTMGAITGRSLYPPLPRHSNYTVTMFGDSKNISRILPQPEWHKFSPTKFLLYSLRKCLTFRLGLLQSIAVVCNNKLKGMRNVELIFWFTRGH